MIPENSKVRNNLGLILTIVALIVLVGVASFGLGRLSALEGTQGSVIIHEPGETAQK